MLLVSNIAFGIFYKKSVMGDISFRAWTKVYPKTKTVLPFILVLVNFKSVRWVLCGFFGLENTQAVFKDPLHSIHRPLKIVTYFKYVFVYCPIFLADILVITTVSWGHQLLVTAIETFLL